MKIFKFKDKTDGNFALVIAENLNEAEKELAENTELKFVLVECENIKIPMILINNILPF